LLRLSRGRDHHIVPNAGIFINNRVLNPAVGTNPDAWLARFFVFGDGFERFVKIATEQDRPIQYCARANETSDATML
jgi:hypothetical protein